MAKLAFTVDADYQKVIRLREEIDRLKSTLSGMDGNTSPGSLRAMEMQLAQNTKEFDRLVTAAAKTGYELETNLKKKIFEASQSVNTFSDKIIDQRVVVREMEADVKNLASSYAKLGKLDPNRGKLLTELNAARASLNEEKAILFGLQQEQSKARLSVKRLRDEYALYNNEGKNVQLTNGGMSVSFGKILGIIGGVGVLKELASEITTVTGQFQRFENVLTNALGGDNNKAKAYLGDIADFAAKTNFQLDELTDNFLKFVNRGVTPTMDSMTKLGDFTNSVSKPYAQLSEAILDINNPERWKEFGVQVQTNGSKVNLTFRGMTVEADRTVQSVMNAIEQFGSMDGIKGSTEAIAGTIEGQMSNLQDTIATVLNEIGQANSDIISGSISMTSTLIENYDKVGRALVGLIGIYGVYRTALVLNAVVKEGFNKAIWANIVATRAAIIAQKTYNKILMMNPWVRLGMVVASLSLGIWALSKRTDEATESQKRLSETSKDFQSEIMKETRIAGELFNQLKKTKEGTTEYSDAKKKILDEYGKYLSGMNTEIATLKDQEGAYNAVTAAIKRNIAEKMKEKFINEGVGDSSAKQSEALKIIRERIYKDVGEDAGKTIFENVKEALSKTELDYKGIVKQMKQSGVKDDAFGYGKVVTDAIVDFRKAEQDIKQVFKDADDLFTQKDNKSAELVPSSVSEEIKTVTANISTLKQQIEDLRNGKTSAEAGKTVQAAIEEKTKELKTAEDALSTLTGKDKSSLKEASDLLKLQSELSRSILDSELKLQAGRIAAMEDGKAKRIALAEQEAKDTIAAIQKEKAEYQTKVKESKDKVDPTVIKTFDNRELAAKEKEKADIARIEKEYAEEYKQRTKALTDVFLNEEERKLSAVKTRYDEERKWADQQLKTGGMTKDEHKSYTTDIDKAQQQETYRSLLDNLNDYKQQEKDLRDKWDTDIAVAAEAKDAYLVAKLMEGKQKALSALNGQMLQETNEWQQLFGDLDNLTVTQIDNLISIIEDKAKDLKLNPVDLREVTNSLNQAKQKVIELNPFKSLGDSIKTVFSSSSKDSKQSSEDIKKDWNNMAKSTEGCFEFVNDAVSSCGVLKDIIGESGQEIIGMIQGVAVAGIAMATAIKTAETASVVLAAISLALQAVTALFSLFNGDKKHEKKIKDLQGQVENLEKAYDRLGRTIENTYSNEVYSLMDQQEAALRRQQALIRQQIREEEAKKKTDKDKVNEYKDKLEELDNQIEDSNRKQIEMWAGTDIQTAIDDFADALIEAYAQGEDGAKAMGDTTKKILANAVKEALKKQLLGKALQDAVTQLGKDMEDGQLSDSDRKRFEDSANAAGKRFTEAMKVYDDLFKDTENQLKDGVSGQLQAATTEGTASQLVGLWNSTAIDMRELKNLSMEQRDSVRSVMDDVREIVKQNYLIEQNTRRGADNTDGLIDELRDGFNTLDKRLGTIEKNTKSYNGRG